MILKSHRFGIAARAIMIALNAVLLGFFIAFSNIYAVWIVLSLLFIYQIYDLIIFTDRTNKEVLKFLSAVKESDFSASFYTPDYGGTMAELTKELNKVIEIFRDNKAEQEKFYRFLEKMVHQLNSGIVVFDTSGKPVLTNSKALLFTGLKQISQEEDLQRAFPRYAEEIAQLTHADKIFLKSGQSSKDMVLSCSEFVVQEDRYRLFALHNISQELEEKELDSWQDLVRVLTHEIMNSITPISSLSETALDIVDEFEGGDDESVQDIKDALGTIRSRSEGLMSYVKSFRGLVKLPKPNIEVFPVSELFANVVKLMEHEFEEKGINCYIEIIPEDLKIAADPALMEQVVLNLLLNAKDAVRQEESPRIWLRAFTDKKAKMLIEVEDNGAGILKDNLERIFIPFFTTKSTGSGIGLSLVRQIMRLHSGKVAADSEPGRTIFRLWL
jgi:nitrogen fixation/metabolism regulation signal transduction histidine kinase